MKQYTLILLTFLAIIPEFSSAMQLETKTRAAKTESRAELLRLALDGYFTQNITEADAKNMQSRTYTTGAELVAAAQESIVAYAKKQLGRIADHEETFLLEESGREIKGRWKIDQSTLFDKAVPLPLPRYNNKIESVAATNINKLFSVEQKKRLLAFQIAELEAAVPTWITELNDAYRKSLRARDTDATSMFQGKRYGYADICTKELRPFILQKSELACLYKGPNKYKDSVIFEFEEAVDKAYAAAEAAETDELRAAIADGDYLSERIKPVQQAVHKQLKETYKPYNHLNEAAIANLNKRILRLVQISEDKLGEDESAVVYTFYLPQHTAGAGVPQFLYSIYDEFDATPEEIQRYQQEWRIELASLCQPELRAAILTPEQMNNLYALPQPGDTISRYLRHLIDTIFNETISTENVALLQARDKGEKVRDHAALMQRVVMSKLPRSFYAFYCLNDATITRLTEYVGQLSLANAQKIIDRLSPRDKKPKTLTFSSKFRTKPTEKQRALYAKVQSKARDRNETVTQKLALIAGVHELLDKENDFAPQISLAQYPEFSHEDRVKINQLVYKLVQQRMPTRHLGMTAEQNLQRLNAEKKLSADILERIHLLLKKAFDESIPALRFAEQSVDDPIVPEGATSAPVAASNGSKTPVAGPDYAPQRAAESAAERQKRVEAMYQVAVAAEAPTPPLTGTALREYEEAVRKGTITEVDATTEELKLADEDMLNFR